MPLGRGIAASSYSGFVSFFDFLNDERLGYQWTGTLGFEAGEKMILLRKGKVARFFDYRGLGRFEGVDRPFAELPRARAVFRVRDLVITPKE